MRIRNNPKAVPFLLQHPLVCHQPTDHRGRWGSFFPNPGKIHIEIGTGKGQFLQQASQIHPDINWMGIEKIPEPLMKAVKKAESLEPQNLRFLLLDANELQKVFSEAEVDRIYLHFSDPWPKTKHYKRRLTYRDFLSTYKQILTPNGDLILKTDNQSLYDFSRSELEDTRWIILEESSHLYNSPWIERNIPTEYEEKFVAQGLPIHYLRARPNR